MIGKMLGHYEITAPLGRGGMGEVFRARDQKLGRDVAIKVLPEEFARDTDRVARFQREAKLLASLNHPNIAAIYGLEESGGTSFLVLELVEGETLAERLVGAAGRPPENIDEALKLALQIAEALEAAHEKGVIHRDLKPANIKVTPDGKVKVLDFGLAKAFAGEQADTNLSNSPTLSNAATQQGLILGTAAYMSPAQARGETVDKKADIWAFGCVLFEMLTGRGTFEGRTVSDILASVIKSEPGWNRLPPNLHPRIRLLLERCLEKEAKNRCHDIADARVDIQKALADPGGVFAQPITGIEPRARMRTILPWAAAALVLGLVIAGVAVWKLNPPEPRRVMRFIYELPEGQKFSRATNGGINLAVSPDGSQFVYGTTEGLYLRSVEALDARLLAGTDKDSTQPFFSPDGQWIGYVSQSDRKLKKIAISGGAPVVICDAPALSTGASWDSDNTIVYSDIIGGGIKRISANGGTPEPLIKGSLATIKEGLPVVPHMLPDGKTLLFTNIFGIDVDNRQIAVQSLESGKRKVLLKGGAAARYLPTGHLVYAQGSWSNFNLLAIPFDLDKLEVRGGSVPMLEGINNFDVSDSGTLVYVSQPGIAAGSRGEAAATAATSSGQTLVWVNRQGKEEPLAAAPDYYSAFRISPDGTRVALTVGTMGKQDIWIWDVARETMTRLTFDEGGDVAPLWTPDGKRIVYTSARAGDSGGVCWKAADGTGEVEKLGSAPDRILMTSSWSKDGKTLVLTEFILTPLGMDIGMLSMEGGHSRKPLLQEKYNENYPQISPDGRWLACASDESGKYEIYVRPFPDVDKGKWQASTNGGDSPLWSPDGRELFYRSGDSIMSVEVETEPTFKPGKPKVLFKGTYVSEGALSGTLWDISPDGKRFLMLKPPASAGAAPTAAVPQPKIHIVVNWFEELKQRVPVK